MKKSLKETEISLPDVKSIKMTDENFLKLLTENKSLRQKNSELNRLVNSLTDQVNTLRAGVKNV